MKRAIIIGASSGIGKALALLLLENGYKVGITGRRTELLNEIKSVNPDCVFPISFDATETSLLHTSLNLLVEQLDGLDLLIFSSGIGELNNSLDIDLELPTVELNVKAFSEVMVWGYQYFEKQKSGQILAITSIAGLRGSAVAPAYNASKAYQINYLEGLRQKAKRAKLQLNIIDVRPGFVATAMAKGDGQFWVSSTKKAASQIFYAIKSKRNVIYVTRRWQIIAWLLKILPRLLY